MKLTNNKRSKVFAFGTGQWARHTSTGTNVIIEGARRSPIGLLIVARITGTKKRRFIVAKATSFAARKGPTPTPLVVGV